MAAISLNLDQFEPLTGEVAAQMPALEEALADLAAGRCAGAEYTGWYDYPRQTGLREAAEISGIAADMDMPFDLLVVIGIGGSYLGTRAVVDALSHSHSQLVRPERNRHRPAVVFCGHHLSGAALVELFDVMDQRQPLINVISKSGTTTEPGVAFRLIRTYMEKRFGSDQAARRILATTDSAKGALHDLAREKGYRSFPVPDNVGGRFSVLSPVGTLPLALAGFDVRALMEGAATVFDDLRNGPEGSGRVALQYAAARLAAWHSGKRIELLTYQDPRLRNLVEWWKQLFGESEGKGGKGLFPAGLGFTTDLHSLGQMVQDGPRHMLETWLAFDELAAVGEENVRRDLELPRVSENLDQLGYLEGRSIDQINQAAMQATRLAHADGGVPCLELSMPRLDEFHLGALFACFEVACGTGAAVLGVNPYDQPGVEDYKRNLFALLGKPGFEEAGADLRRRLQAPG